MFTVEPRGACPPAGDCDSTTPGMPPGANETTTLNPAPVSALSAAAPRLADGVGHVDVHRALRHEQRDGGAPGCVVPSAGSVRVARPPWIRSLGSIWIVTSNPAVRRLVSAVACGRLATAGMSTAGLGGDDQRDLVALLHLAARRRLGAQHRARGLVALLRERHDVGEPEPHELRLGLGFGPAGDVGQRHDRRAHRERDRAALLQLLALARVLLEDGVLGLVALLVLALDLEALGLEGELGVVEGLADDVGDRDRRRHPSWFGGEHAGDEPDDGGEQQDTEDRGDHRARDLAGVAPGRVDDVVVVGARRRRHLGLGDLLARREIGDDRGDRRRGRRLAPREAHQVVAQVVGRLVAGLEVLRHRDEDDPLEVGRDVGLHVAEHRRLLAHVLVRDRDRGVAAERRLAR